MSRNHMFYRYITGRSIHTSG